MGTLASGFLEITIQMAKCTVLGWLLSSLAKVAEASRASSRKIIEQETTESESSLVLKESEAETVSAHVEADTAGCQQRTSKRPAVPMDWQLAILKSETGYFQYVYLGAEEQNKEILEVFLSLLLIVEEITKNKATNRCQ